MSKYNIGDRLVRDGSTKIREIIGVAEVERSTFYWIKSEDWGPTTIGEKSLDLSYSKIDPFFVNGETYRINGLNYHIKGVYHYGSKARAIAFYVDHNGEDGIEALDKGSFRRAKLVGGDPE